MKAVRWIERWVGFLGCFMVVGLMFMVASDVFMRFVFSRPINEVWELSQFSMAALVWCFVAYTFQVKGHISVDFVVSRFSPRMRTILEIFSHFLTLIVFGLIVWQGVVASLASFHWAEVSQLNRTPMGPIKILVPAGSLLVCLEMVIQLTQSIKELQRG